MPSIVDDLEIIFAVIVDINKCIDLLTNFGMAPIFGDVEDLGLEMVYMLENFAQFFNLARNRQFRVFVLPFDHQHVHVLVSRSILIRVDAIRCVLELLPKVLQANVALPSIDHISSWWYFQRI